MDTNSNIFIDIGEHSINKLNEELCGDKVEIFKGKDKYIIVLADGLGSGVKANILATLTTKIAITMLKSGESIEETINTIMETLPVCKVRGIAYSTFGVIEIDKDLNCRTIEYDNPPLFFVRDGKILKKEKEEKVYDTKKVKFASYNLKEGDKLTLVSDGVIHAGVGNTLNLGWQWSHVADYLVKQKINSAEIYNRRLILACKSLYDDKPGDDTTSVSVTMRKKQCVNVLIGPPIDITRDNFVANKLLNSKGKKVICGGTTAQIVARELNLDLDYSIVYHDKNVPPTANLKGFDLVTEGIITINSLLKRLKKLNHEMVDINLNNKDAVSRLGNLLVDQATHINFLVGRAVNCAHESVNINKEIGIKSEIIEDVISELKKMGKEINIEFY